MKCVIARRLMKMRALRSRVGSSCKRLWILKADGIKSGSGGILSTGTKEVGWGCRTLRQTTIGRARGMVGEDVYPGVTVDPGGLDPGLILARIGDRASPRVCDVKRVYLQRARGAESVRVRRQKHDTRLCVLWMCNWPRWDSGAMCLSLWQCGLAV